MFDFSFVFVVGVVKIKGETTFLSQKREVKRNKKPVATTTMSHINVRIKFVKSYAEAQQIGKMHRVLSVFGQHFFTFHFSHSLSFHRLKLYILS